MTDPSSEPEPSEYQILVVDDNARQVEIVQHCLAGDRMQEYAPAFRVHAAVRAADARNQLNDDFFDAVLLSLHLNGGEWRESLEEIRQLQPAVPVVVISAVASDESALAALRAGADDCLSDADLWTQTLPRALRYAIERRRRMAAEAKLQAAQLEVAAAQAIHLRLLPRKAPEIPTLDLAGTCIPAETVGGDLFDFLAYDEKGCLGVVADVSGHGLPAAILMTELHGLLHGLIEQNFDLVRIARAAHQRILDAAQCHQFITMLLYQLSVERRELSYVSAGHPGWLLKRNGETIDLCSRQVPLGVDVDHPQFSLLRLPLESGDLFVAPTDGVFEALGEKKQLFGIERMLDLIRSQAHRPAREIVTAVAAAVSDFINRKYPADDCTLVVIKVK